MRDVLSARILLDARPTTAALAGLRALFPSLAAVPVARMRAALDEWPVCVVGTVTRGDADALRAQVRALGIGIELFTDEDYPTYVGALLPGSAECARASDACELLVLPSFSPELVIRLWIAEGRGHLQVASMGTSVWARRFDRPPWLGREHASPTDAAAPERPGTSTGEVPASEVARLLEDAWSVVEPSRRAGLDGTSLVIEVRTGTRRRRIAAWSGHRGGPFAVLARASALARSCLSGVDGEQRLDELRQALDG